MPTLYRQYRPKTFAEVTGQNHIKVTLENELTTGRLAHAYLFSGPRGVGKTTVARLLAKSVNCEKRKANQAEACNTCPSCTEVLHNQAIDLLEIDAASHTGVDNVRENIIDSARFTPTKRKYKIYIIDEVHMLSTAAFNALLKILEEPPVHVIFILATTEIHKVPETIISRCQRFDFKRIPYHELVERMEKLTKAEKVSVAPEVISTIARLSGGSARDAESLLGQVLILDDKAITAEMASVVLPRSNAQSALEFVGHLCRRDAANAISLIHKTIDEGVDLVQFTRDVVELLRQALLSKVVGGLSIVSAAEVDPEVTKRLDEVTRNISVPEITAMLGIFLRQERLIKLADQPALPLEMAVVEICVQSDDQSPPNSGPTATKTASPTAPAKKPIKPTARSGAAAVSLDDLHAGWATLVKTVKPLNQPLALTLKVCRPTKFEDGRLTIACEFGFHAERLNEPKNKGIIEDALAEVFNTKLSLATVIERSAPATVQAEPRPQLKSVSSGTSVDGFIDGLLQSFGGKVVD